MTKQVINTNAPNDLINVGSSANAKNGDPLRTAFIKINDALDRIDANFTELYNASGADVQIPSQSGQTGKYLTTNGTTLSWSTISQFSGNYSDLTNKPVLFSGDYNDLTNKPVLFSGDYSDLTNKPTVPTLTSELTNDSNFVVKDTPPITLAGSLGDVAGTVAFDNNYIYYCTANYVEGGAGGATVTLVPNELGQNVNTLTIAKGAPPNTGWATPQVGWTLTVNSTTVTVEQIDDLGSDISIIVSGFITLPPTGDITFTEPGGVQPDIWVQQAWGGTLNIIDGGNATTF